MSAPRRIVILGLTLSSSWGNGHATTYRGLMRELCALGHEVLFLERDTPWYREHRDLARPPYGRLEFYDSLEALRDGYLNEVADADLVMVGSFVPDGIEAGRWVLAQARGVTAFYDIDTPVTLARVAQKSCAYLNGELIPRYDLYLSFTGGPTLQRLERDYGAACARPLYCAVDPALHAPQPGVPRWDLGYLGTYAADRQPALEQLLLDTARQWTAGRYVVAGPSYPGTVSWPDNVQRIEHLPPAAHAEFYAGQRYTLNLTRADMRRAGYSPSVRLFEAAACGIPVISDEWPGLESFLMPGREILTAGSAAEVLYHLRRLPEERRLAIGHAARARVLAEHTAACRARTLIGYLESLFRTGGRSLAAEGGR
jgi:spore maturation protein CgeB